MQNQPGFNIRITDIQACWILQILTDKKEGVKPLT